MNDQKIKIKVRGLSKVFGSHPKRALELRKQGLKRPEILEKTGQTLGLYDINFDVYEGELLVIMGLSGSGKSTLIRCLNRLIEPSAGQIFIDEQEITNAPEKKLLDMRRRFFSMVFQNFALFPHRTVLENVEFGLEIRGIPKIERTTIAQSTLEQVGLKSWAHAYPKQLSGGMQQRVGIARAIANDGGVLLMDEAFSALDPLIRKDMQQELQELQYRTKKTTIFITHDLDEALNIGDRIILLKDGEIVQQGTPEDILTKPADEYVARFIEGVDKTRILSASCAMRPVRATARPSDGPHTTARKMRDNDVEALFVLQRDRSLVGLIDSVALKAALRDGASSIENYITTDVPTVSPDEPLNAIFGLFGDRSIPLPVLNDKRQLLGVIIKGAVLDELAKAGETV